MIKTPISAILAALASVSIISFSSSAFAAPITINSSDFSGINASVVPDSFGDTANVDFTWSIGGSTLKWNGDYSGNDAFYCGTNSSATCTFTIQPLGGQTLTLDSFTLGGWPNAARDIDWGITDLGSLTLLSSGTANVPAGTTPLIINPGLSSLSGFSVSFGPDGFNGGLVSLTYSLSSPPTHGVPEPATAALLGLGLLGIAALRRKLR